MPRARPAAPRSAIHYPAPHQQRPCYLGVSSKKGERKQNSQEKFNTFGESEIAANPILSVRIAKPYDSAKSRIPTRRHAQRVRRRPFTQDKEELR
jgi:hypothetical protein